MSFTKAAIRLLKVVEAPCANCKGKRSQTVQGAFDHESTIDEQEFWGRAEFDLLECNGCHTGTFRRRVWTSEDIDGPTTTYFPAIANERSQRKPKDFDGLAFGSPLEHAYRQTITALNQELNILAGAGVRLLVEGICNEKNIADGPVVDAAGQTHKKNNLEGRINGLVDVGLIAAQQASTLHEIRFLGNDSAHELDSPSRDVLESAIGIVEHILSQIYEQPEQAKTVAGRKRPAKP